MENTELTAASTHEATSKGTVAEQPAHVDQQEMQGQEQDGAGESVHPAQPPTTTPSGAPMPTTTDPTLIEAWDRCWAIVKATPTEFDTWEELMRLADRQDGGFGPDAPAANISNVRTIYNDFLSQFPLCFGYWKKYSDLEFLARGVEGAIEIFERGVKSITNSVDLWVQYCSFVMEHKPEDREMIEQLFQRGANSVGMDFMPHVFWDKFIAFYEEKEEYAKLAKLMERIIKIPMHQYARYYQQYTQLLSTRPLTDLISDEQYKEYVTRLSVPEKVEGQEQESTPVEKSKEQLEAEIRQLLLESCASVNTRTGEETLKRWPFEAEIKRPYFHVKPMDMPQLTNWRRYLDFEETEGDVERIRVLYERCLVTCALYEEFWLRYGSWARSQDNLEELKDIYSRAVVLVPSSNPSLRLALAMVEEEIGNTEAARQQYQTALQLLPGHIETIVRFANFERRTCPDELSAAELVYASQLGLDNVDELTQTSIATLYARFLWQTKKDADAARAIFKTFEGKFDSKFYFSSYLKFEMDQPGEDYEQRVSSVFEQVRSSGLSEAVKNDFGQSYLDFVMEFGTSAARYNQLEADIKTPSVYVVESKKRAAAERAEEEERAKKQARQEDETMTLGADTSAAPEAHAATAAAVDPAVTAVYDQQQHWGTAAASYGYPATVTGYFKYSYDL
ncbi:hypothetical protein BGZ50_001984 [Haplosporangium sp. Z 11]|nr:hypothetical protein BGZ50_001984 [Haplosporangium sp. Z 11]